MVLSNKYKLTYFYQNEINHMIIIINIIFSSINFINSNVIKKAFLRYSFCFIFGFTFSQSMFDTLTINEQQRDFEILSQTLLEYHQGLFDYSDSSEIFERLENLKEVLKTKHSIVEQYALYANFIASINCIHTTCRNKIIRKDIKKTNLLLPFRTYYSNNNLIATQSYSKDSCLLIDTNDIILKINSLPISEIKSELFKMISSDGQNTTYKEASLRFRFEYYYYLNYLPEDSILLTYTHKKDTLEKYFYTISYDSLIPKTNSEINQKKKLKKEPNNLISYLDSSNRFVYLKLPYPLPKNFFYHYKIKHFFRNIDTTYFNNLVIDLRNNGGGKDQSHLAGYFTKNKYTFETATCDVKHFKPEYYKYFLNRFSYYNFTIRCYKFLKKQKIYCKPKTYYPGNLYVFTNGLTGSAASNLASTLKEKSNAIIIGEETGGGYRGCNTGLLYIELPHSKMVITINHIKVKNNITKEYELDGVTPNYYINIPYNYFNQTDYYIEELKEIIQK